MFADFEFGLGADEEQRARRLHEEAVIVDLLCMGPCGYRSFSDDMEREIGGYVAGTDDVLAALNFVLELPVRRALATGDDGALEECWRASGVTAGSRGRDFATAADIVKGLGIAAAQFAGFPWLVRATHPDHIRKAKQNRSIAGLVNTQDPLGFGTDLDLLERAHDLGLAMVQLTYNSTNFIGTGCMEISDVGLTDFGRRFVERLNDLGIIIDLSHCGHRTTLEACALSKRPVVASHTSARALCDHNRAKTDDEIKAIADTGGVVGICAVPFFLSPDPAPSIETMLDHIDYVAQLVGRQHVAIGTDWPLQMPKSALQSVYRDFQADYTRNLVGFDDYRDFPNITRGLVARGYDDEEICGILGENVLRVFAAVTD